MMSNVANITIYYMGWCHSQHTKISVCYNRSSRTSVSIDVSFQHNQPTAYKDVCVCVRACVCMCVCVYPLFGKPWFIKTSSTPWSTGIALYSLHSTYFAFYILILVAAFLSRWYYVHFIKEKSWGSERELICHSQSWRCRTIVKDQGFGPSSANCLSNICLGICTHRIK
jgi:hypothetical protein